MPTGDGYFVDLFNVRGGKEHDYAFHGQVTDRGEGFSLDGALVKPVKGVWTLAGLSGYANATFDAPKRSWGERIIPGSAIGKLGIPGEKVGYFGWYLPPGNGYGFIYDVRVGQVDRWIRADWLTHKESNIHLRVHLLPGRDSTVITGKAPDLTGTKVIPFLVVRRRGDNLASSFLGVMEGYVARPCIRSVEEAPAFGQMRGVVVEVDGGITDHIWLNTDGGAALIRMNGNKVIQVTLYQAQEVSHADIGLKLMSTAFTGVITSVAYDEHSFSTTIKPVNPSALRGHTLLVTSPDYKCNTAYRIEYCDDSGMFNFGLVGFDLAVADYSYMRRDGSIVSSTPMTLTWLYGEPRATGMLDGKLARTIDGQHRGLIAKFENLTVFQFNPGFSIRRGDRFVIYDVKPGDRVIVPMIATMHLRSDKVWELFATRDVIVTLPAERLSYRDANGRWASPPRTQGGFPIPISKSANGRIILRAE